MKKVNEAEKKAECPVGVCPDECNPPETFMIRGTSTASMGEFLELASLAETMGIKLWCHKSSKSKPRRKVKQPILSFPDNEIEEATTNNQNVPLNRSGKAYTKK